jgi:hypothetical protein
VYSLQSRLQAIKEKFKSYDESPFFSDSYMASLSIEDIRWLLKTVETYKAALMQIGAKCEPPASAIANETLMKVDLEKV